MLPLVLSFHIGIILSFNNTNMRQCKCPWVVIVFANTVTSLTSQFNGVRRRIKQWICTRSTVAHFWRTITSESVQGVLLCNCNVLLSQVNLYKKRCCAITVYYHIRICSRSAVAQLLCIVLSEPVQGAMLCNYGVLCYFAQSRAPFCDIMHGKCSLDTIHEIIECCSTLCEMSEYTIIVQQCSLIML